MGIVYIGNILYDEKLFKSRSRVVIFGSGICGKNVAKYLQENGMRDKIVCFCDSNKNLRNSYTMGIPIWGSSEVCRSYPDADYLIGGKYSRKMYEFLKERQIEKIHILVI